LVGEFENVDWVTFIVWWHNCKWKTNAYTCMEACKVCVTFNCTI